MLHQVGFGIKFIKDYNELNVLRFVKQAGPISRAEIAKQLHLSKASVSEIVADLINQSYLAETGIGDSTFRGGRRPIMLSFNQKAGYVIAIEIERTSARIDLVDMDAKIHASKTILYSTGCDLSEICERIYPIIQNYLLTDWVHYAKALGIGIGIPGLIDYDRRCIKHSDSLKNWENVSICDMFEEKFDIQTIIENNVKIQTLGECLFGQGKESQNLVNLWIGDGIGAGIFLNGSLIRGVSASAGEIGYAELGFFIKDGLEFPLLYNNQKTLSDILSNRSLIDAARKALQNGYRCGLKEEKLTPEYIMQSAEEKDPLGMALIKEYGALIGILCINLINTLNVELLIINGPVLAESELLLGTIKEKVQKDLLTAPATAVRIVLGALKEQGVVLGATGLVLEDLFYQDKMNLQKYRSIFK